MKSEYIVFAQLKGLNKLAVKMRHKTAHKEWVEAFIAESSEALAMHRAELLAELNEQADHEYLQYLD